MARKEKLTRHNLILFEGDMAELQRQWPQLASTIVRTLVRKYLQENKSPEDLSIVVDMEEGNG